VRDPRWRLALAVAIGVLAADQATKALVARTLRLHETVVWLPVFAVTYVRNTGAAFGVLADVPPGVRLPLFLAITLGAAGARNGGAAFSIGTSMTIVFTAIAVGVIVYILRAARNLRSIGWAITLGLLLGGATGNLLDRIFRAPGPFQGHVVDWIELPDWPVFNLADSAITTGVAVVLLHSLRRR